MSALQWPRVLTGSEETTTVTKRRSAVSGPLGQISAVRELIAEVKGALKDLDPEADTVQQKQPDPPRLRARPHFMDRHR